MEGRAPDSELFIGRESELEDLRRLFGKKSASLVVVKGRRRVGKSRLVEHFAHGRAFYPFTGLPPSPGTTAQDQRNEFAKQLAAATGLPEVIADDWSKLFSLLRSQVTTGRKIVLFDEISWMGSEDHTFLGQLKNAWDMEFKKNPKLIFILCGSVSSWIETNILNSAAFLGRISWTLTLKELPLPLCDTFLDRLGFKMSSYEKFKVLSVTGGIPWYLEQIQGGMNADENIKQLCFNPGGVLVHEFDKIFHDLFKKRGKLYKLIVRFLINGPREYKTIADSIKYESSGRLTHYLDELIMAGFISRYYTWSLKTGNKSRLSQYRLTDNYIRFYLKNIEPNLDKIEHRQFDDVSMSSLPGWDTIMGLQFENLVLNSRGLILDLLQIRGEDIIADNPYFERGTKTKPGVQIDYLIHTRHRTLYLCEIRFSRRELSTKVIRDVQEKSNRLSLPRGYSILPVLIHVSGVTENVVNPDYFFKIIDFSALLHDKKR